MPTVLISCGKLEKKYRCMAGLMYTSPQFTLAYKAAKIRGYKVLILSAKHNLLSPLKMISPYEMTLNTFSNDELCKWYNLVAESIDFLDDIVLLASKLYSGFVPLVRNRVYTPLAGKGLFDCIKWLSYISKNPNASLFYYKELDDDGKKNIDK